MTLADVTERLMAEFEDRHSLTEIVAAVASCRRDLQASAVPAQPDLLERLARQRLLDACAPPAVPAPPRAERLSLT